MNPFNDPRDEFTPKELMAGAGINVTTYNGWLFRGTFIATHEADGAGTVSSYTFDDILKVALIVKLRLNHIALKKASRIASELVFTANGYLQATHETDLPLAYSSLDEGIRIEFEDKKRSMVLRLDIQSLIYNVAGRIDEAKP